jgi:hypothetical protein
MEKINLKNNSTDKYSVAVPDNGPIFRVRGQGKYAWCARKVINKLRCGENVWIKTINSSLKNKLSHQVGIVPEFIPVGWETKYDYFFSETKSRLKGEAFFGSYSFSETVGLWLEQGTEEASSLLSPIISTEGFVFSPEEYLDLLERLRVALRRYDRLPAVSNGLEDLNTGFFRHRNLEESTAFIRKHLAEYLQRGADLQRNFLLAINLHARSWATEKRKELRERSGLLEKLEEGLKATAETTGRRMKKASLEIANEWQAYLHEYNAGEEEAVKGLTVETLSAAIEKEQASITSGFRLVGRQLKTEGMSLNALTVQPQHGNSDKLRELEGLLNELLREVDEAGLYQLPLRLTDAATTPRQLQQLESLLSKLRNTERHLKELPMFYDRRHFWYAQPAHLRRLLAPLLDLPSEDWEIAFSSWYFERCLEREERPGRFHRKAKLLGLNQEITNESPAPKSGDLHFLALEEPWPVETEVGDLFVDLSGGIQVGAEMKAQALSLAPLSDTSAMHLAVTGYRNPALLFSQSFQPLHPPQWGAHKVEVPPAGPEGCVMLQVSEATPWIPLSEWVGDKGEELNVFLPKKLDLEAENSLIERWELLIISAPKITFFHAYTNSDITQGLLSDGFNGAFLISVLLRAAEAAESIPFDRDELVALGREVRIRCGLTEPGAHPLAVQFGTVLAEKLPGYFIETHVPWRDTFLPLVLQSPSGKKSVFLPDGYLPGLTDYETETARHRELETAGFLVLGLNALNIWEDWAGELDRIVGNVVV